MNNPFLQDGESTHEYKNQMFVVDFYPHPLGNTWQCSDSSHYIRARANTKQEAIDQAHKEWDEYKPTETMTNNKQQTEINAVEYLDKVNQFAKGNNTGKPKQQTAVEWLLNAIETKNGEEFSSYYTEFIEQAKEMEKEQKIMDYEMGYINGGNQKKITGEQYYNETYK
jgi:hypothetical protein